ncbi:MAG: 5'/3'-nucleotidase SurE [Prevotellaceae bacterium]|nr:5'/3'-nucleotidase SurE [Prevotella sp.]MDD7258374.1 5'/3'-nucleotidase SurE [Prevotellaceae bacterium]MDY6129932.1 5'/3'-nucleotidase SurE [Prevotella sp.]
MENKRPFILISNDDGYQSKGIRSLIDMVKDFGDILVCAPEGPRSGFACAFSATTPLRLKFRNRYDSVEIWSCNGTPVDCVKLAWNQFCRERKPDLVIGGINHGDNASVNTHYSGTMGVTMEGCLKRVPSVAFSVCDHSEDANFEPNRPYVRSIVGRLLEEGLPEGVCLNVNFPVAEAYKGVKICRMAYGTWKNECVKCRHPHGYDYFWMTGSYTNDEPEAEDTDNWALVHGYVAITPTQMDVTSYKTMERMKSWTFGNLQKRP